MKEREPTLGDPPVREPPTAPEGDPSPAHDPPRPDAPSPSREPGTPPPRRDPPTESA